MEYRPSRRSFLKDTLMGVSSAGIGFTSMKKNAVADALDVTYQPTWESLDAHPCPGWFHDAKLGMYFHWGVCSVPAWAPRKEGISYAEWYWFNMNDRNNPTWQYHRDTHGENFTYDDFIPLFKAERYDPENCLTVKELIDMVVNGVSRNGNFDINVGPTAEGIISDVEREPLADFRGYGGFTLIHFFGTVKSVMKKRKSHTGRRA